MRLSAQPSNSTILDRSVSKSVAACASARAEISAVSGVSIQWASRGARDEVSDGKCENWGIVCGAFRAPCSTPSSPGLPAKRSCGMAASGWATPTRIDQRSDLLAEAGRIEAQFSKPFGLTSRGACAAQRQAIIVDLKRHRAATCGTEEGVFLRMVAERQRSDGERYHEPRVDITSAKVDAVLRRGVGAGPAGLAAAIRLKSLNSEISVVVVEKGSTIGAHILSGAVIDPIGLDQLTPDWRSDPECPLKTRVATDQFYYLTETRRVVYCPIGRCRD